jgi:hypothetical protein
MEFVRATKQQAKLRCALFGPAGAGKTMSMLRIATGIGGPIAVIDTERSASKYADRWEFDVLELADRTVDGYVAAITLAARQSYPVLCVDSLSHGWEEIKTAVDHIAKAKYRGNTWSAWSEGTPLYRRFMDALLQYPGHVLVTMRSATEWTVEEQHGRKTPVRVGTYPEMRKGSEFEMDLLVEMNEAHIGRVIKDRTGKFQDRLIDRPGEQFGAELAAWLGDGAAPAPAPATPPPAAPAPRDDGRITVTVNGRQIETAGVTAATLVAIWDAARKVDAAQGAGTAKRVLAEDFALETTTELTARAGKAYLVQLGTMLALAVPPPDGAGSAS